MIRDEPAQASLKGEVSGAEWQARVDLAALYRLVALYGWDDAVFTHISMRVPGPEHHFLINPYGSFFEEMTASALVKIDMDGNIVQPTPHAINAAGFTIHSAIHGARPDARCVIHLHTDQGIAVSAQIDGLLPITQNALILMPQIAYHDYEGIALDLGERDRLVADLGSKNLMILRNHGTLSAGETASQAWMQIYRLERACQQQVYALSAGFDRLLIAPQAAQDTVLAQTRSNNRAKGGQLAWPGFLRRLDRQSPGYDI